MNQQRGITMTKGNLYFTATLVVLLGNAFALPVSADLQLRDDAKFGSKAIVYDTATGLEWVRLQRTPPSPTMT